jgi:hypothetical protein
MIAIIPYISKKNILNDVRKSGRKIQKIDQMSFIDKVMKDLSFQKEILGCRDIQDRGITYLYLASLC